MTKREAIAGVALLIINAAAPARAEPPAAQRAEFETADGVAIVAGYFPPTGRAISPAAVLLPIYQHERSSWKPLVGPLHDAGFAVLAIDLRGHGESVRPESKELPKKVEQRDTALFAAMYEDVSAAVKWVRQQPNVDPDRLVLIGASVGCSVAIDYAGRDSSVDAIVCLSPGENYLGLDSTAHIEKILQLPVLLIATEEERAAVDTLSKLSPAAKTSIVGPGRVHGTDMFGKIEGIEEKIVGFAAQAVFSESSEP